MQMEGDGREGQPAESVVSLESLADAMDEGGAALDDPGESEESEESEDDGVEADEAEAEGEEPDDSDATVVLEHNGKEVTVSKEEAKKLAQMGFDYTSKTMAVAEERKAVEAEKAQVSEVRSRHEMALQAQLERLEAVERFMQAQIGDPPPIEWAQQDAAYYLAQKELHESRKGQLQEASKAVKQVREEAQRQRQAMILEQAEQTEKALRDTLPGWSDAVMQEYVEYAGGLGLSVKNADLAFLQPGMWQLIHKAKQFDALLAKKAEMKPVAQLPKVSRPGNNNQPPQLARRQEAMKRHKSAPSLNTLADLL